MSVDRRTWKPLPPILDAAVSTFDTWSNAHLLAAEVRNAITAPLYHHTDAAGLEGIIKNQQVWFTRYTHLNDPTELEFGMSVATELLSEVGAASDGRIRIFCDMVKDLFTLKNMSSSFGFFIGSFSRERDDLGQWRAYGNNGRGFSLGLAPRLFGVEDKTDRQPHENVFVVPVVYGKKAARQHHLPAIESAVRIVGKAVVEAADLMQDISIGMPFFDKMAKALIASPMLFNCLTIKDGAYEHEKEIKLIIVGERRKLAPHVSTRRRRRKVIPFIKSDMPIQSNGSIVEIVVGPAAADNAEDAVRALLKPFHATPNSIMRRSKIPYRAD